MTKREFIEGLMDTNQITRDDATKIVEIVFDHMRTCLLDGREVRIDGVGAFVVRYLRPGMVRNNIIGEDQEVGPRIKLKFRTFRSMQKALNNGLAQELEDAG